MSVSATDDANPFESAADRRAATAAEASVGISIGRDDDEQSLLRPASPSGALAEHSRTDGDDDASAGDVESGPSDAAQQRDPSLSPTTSLLINGPPRPPESMSRFAHALPDLSSFSSDLPEDAPLPEISVPDEPDIWRSRGERLARTLFGAVLTCHCEINDEVRLTVWLLGLVAGLIWLGFFIAETRLHVVTAADLALHERILAIALGGCFTFVACLLTFVQIKDHLRNWVHPPSQRCVVRILLMVPVYSVSAWLSLIFTRYSLYIDFIRGCYEAFVIYSFMILLTKYLGGHTGVVECMQYKTAIKWPNPFCFLPPVKPNSSFLYYLKYGTLQYTIAMPIISLLAVVMNVFGYYGDGIMRADRGYVYVTMMTNLSQLLALYTLVWLYVILKNELLPFKPFNKFLVVKAVVFFTFWQGIAIAFAAHVGLLKPIEGLELGEVEVGLQDFLICIEMFIAAATHKYAFGFETYKNGTIKLLMDQRAFYLAQKSYQRAVQTARFKENEARIEAGLPPLPAMADVRTVLPTGSDVLGASDEALEAAKASAPAPAGSGPEVDVRVVRVVPTPDGIDRSIMTQVRPGSSVAAEMARAGYRPGQEDEGDALFDDDDGPSHADFVAESKRGGRGRGGRLPPPPMTRARSSIQLTLGGPSSGIVELAPVSTIPARGSLRRDGVQSAGAHHQHHRAPLGRVASLSALRQAATSPTSSVDDFASPPPPASSSTVAAELAASVAAAALAAAAMRSAAASAPARRRSRGSKRLSLTLTPATPSGAPDAATVLLTPRGHPVASGMLAAPTDGADAGADSDPYPSEGSDYHDSDVGEADLLGHGAQAPRRGDDSEDD